MAEQHPTFRESAERVLAWTAEQQKNRHLMLSLPTLDQLPLLAACMAATTPRLPIIKQIARVRTEG